MPLLEFIFRGFWTFLGAVILVGVTLSGIAHIILACRGIEIDDEAPVDKDYEIVEE